MYILKLGWNDICGCTQFCGPLIQVLNGEFESRVALFGNMYGNAKNVLFSFFPKRECTLLMPKMKKFQ